ncbi:hypothetical protein ACSNOJ_08120 [Streptomyces sp. URMC 128]|uniref:hypothetical protein n=1 Tax=Streptomyces sp. URMC 128 TaxID=3423404 RepID=UPI003F198775
MEPAEQAEASASAHEDFIPGPVAAAILACGIGSAVFGAAVVASDASPAVKAAFTLHEGVGPLSGKTVVGSLAYLASWGILHRILRRRTVRTRTALVATAALVGVGLLLTFPPIFQIWAVH